MKEPHLHTCQTPVGLVLLEGRFHYSQRFLVTCVCRFIETMAKKDFRRMKEAVQLPQRYHLGVSVFQERDDIGSVEDHSYGCIYDGMVLVAIRDSAIGRLIAGPVM